MKIQFAAILLLTLLFLAACSAPKRGCSDIRAVNFSFDADEPCSGSVIQGDCPCVYPKLVFSPSADYTIKTAKGDSVVKWKTDGLLINKVGQKYFLKRYSFYLSDIRMSDAAGSVFTIADSISVPVKQTASDSGTITLLSDIILIGENSGSITVGNFLHSGFFRNLGFTFGLEGPQNQANITSIKMPDSPLNTDSMYLRNEYRLLGGKFFYETEAGKSGALEIRQSKKVNIPIPTDLFFEPATNLTVKLKIDFRKFFDDIDFEKHSPTQMESLLLENCRAVFSVSK